MNKFARWLLIAVALTSHSLATGQTAGGDGQYTVFGRGPHHRTWGRVTAQADRAGTVHYRTNSFKELATALCVWSPETREWTDASEALEITADGCALARHTQHQLIVAPTVTHPGGVLDCLMPDGQRFRVTVLGLNLYSPVTGQSLQIATVKDCAGVQVPPNEILFDDIFDGMLRGGLRIRNLLGEVHHDVLLAERFSAAQLEKLAALGFDSRMRLEVWTEVLEAPTPAIETSLVKTLAEQGPGTLADPNIYDSSVCFGSMSLLPGSTFVEGEDDSARVPVYKQWYTDGPSGRVVLIEGASYSDVEPLMRALPESTMTVFNEGTSSGRLLSNWRRVTSTNTEVRIARAEARTLPSARPRVVWDFNLGNTTLTNFTGRADDTVYVSGNARIAGTLVLEGNCVLKFTNYPFGSIIASNLVLKTGPFSPVVLTAKDNDNIGAVIAGSTGIPTNWYGYTALDLAGALTNPVLSHVRFSYLKNTLKGASMTVRDCQFTRCGNAFGAGSSYAELKLQNVLLHRLDNVVYVNPNGWTLKGEHVTAHYCTNFMQLGSPGSVCLTNSLLVSVGNWYTASTYTNTTAVLDSDAGVFNTVGAGSHYLAESSPYRNAGTTNVTPVLLSTLEQRTTFAPVLYSATNFANQGITFSPRAPRDSDFQPDLGYHYAPIDYLASQLLVTNSALTVTPGTVLGVLAPNTNSYGLGLGTGARFSCIGSPTSRNWVVAYNTVQELSDSGWSQPDLGGLVDVPGQSLQSIACRFTSWSVMDQMARHVSVDWDQAFGFQDCEFRSGRIWALPSSLSFTNCLFERVLVHLFPEDLRRPWVRNCLFLGGVFAFSPSVTNAVVKDNLFDGAEVPDYITSSVGAYDGDFNAYVTNGVPANFRLKPFCATDILLANSPQYQVGPLGNHYLLTGSGLINADTNTAANSVGLYHYTVCSNLVNGWQIKETNSWLDVSYHYVAVDTNGVPIDTDLSGASGGAPDYLEDGNGDGSASGDPSDWTTGHGSDDSKYLLVPGYLRCEYRVDPWGVDAKDPWTGKQKPRLFWIVTSTNRAEKQVAYQILVATSTNLLAANSSDMWDSGKVYSDQTIHVEYNGKDLQSGQRLWWKVRTWDLYSGLSTWSTNGFLQIGLLDPSNEWSGAKWIGINNYVSGSSPCPMFRKEFQLTNQVRCATAYASAKGVYDLWINGSKIGPNILAPEWTNPTNRIQYQTFEVTTNLLSGSGDYPSNNVVGAIVAEGWFGNVSDNSYGTPDPQVLVRLVITYTNDSTVAIQSDTTWTSYTNGAIGSASILDGENIDANKEGFTPDWATRSYAQTNLFTTNSTVAHANDPSLLIAQPNDPIRTTQTVSAGAPWVISSDSNAVVKVFDMGQNMVGWCKLTLVNPDGAGAVGRHVTLKHAEVLNLGANNETPNGPSTRGIFTNNLVGAKQEDDYILNAETNQEFQPHFTYHGFRFVQVTAPPAIAASLTNGTLIGCVNHSGVPFTGAFACYGTNVADANARWALSNNLVNKLMTNALWGMRGNLQGVFTACTQRAERMGYFYDEHIFSQTACYFADMAAFLCKFIRDIRDAQLSSGQYPVYAPYASSWWPPSYADPGCEVGGLVFPWRLYENYGDSRILAEHYASASNWVRYATTEFTNHIWADHDDDGKGTNFQFNVADWMHSFHTIDNRTTVQHPAGYAPVSSNYSGLEGTNWGTAWYAYSADTLAAMARALQNEALLKGSGSNANLFYTEYTNYLALATAVRSAYTNLSTEGWIAYDTNHNITKLFHNTQADCIMALIFNMVPENQRSNVISILLDGTFGINNFNSYFGVTPRLSTGYFCSSRGMLELTRNGYTRLAYKLLLDARFPSWVYPADRNFTTCWEGWNTYVDGVGDDRGYYSKISPSLCSFNHLPFGAVGEWVWKVIGGINPDSEEPGFANVIIRPEPGGGVTNSLASFSGIHGTVVCSWTNDMAANGYVLNVTVPANTTATIFMPTTNNPSGFTENGLGTIYGASSAPGVMDQHGISVPGWTNGASVFCVGSGTYRFAITNVILQ